jgi:hypothetical protein
LRRVELHRFPVGIVGGGAALLGLEARILGVPAQGFCAAAKIGKAL